MQNEIVNPAIDVEEAVRSRYSEGAKACESALCCAVQYDRTLLEAIPPEVIERDYGCGDPTKYVRAGETVLDLGSGSGKACFIASQVVGPTGTVIGIDMNDDMLGLARSAAPVVAEKIGFANVEFKKAKIQDMRLDRDRVDRHLAENPVSSHDDYVAFEAFLQKERQSFPAVPNDSVDVVVSNCVLNLVRPEDKRLLFEELFRVLKRGGRAVISDIVSDEDIPHHLQENAELWSGCISGAYREDAFLEAFREVGFYGIAQRERTAEPWQTVEGIEFRSVTVIAYKGKEGPCLDQKHAVIYRGPFSQVEDDDGHILRRGVRSAVCEKTFRLYSSEPYREHFDLVEPRVVVPLDDAPEMRCGPDAELRHPKESKGQDYRATTEATGACGVGNEPSKPGCC